MDVFDSHPRKLQEVGPVKGEDDIGVIEYGVVVHGYQRIVTAPGHVRDTQIVTHLRYDREVIDSKDKIVPFCLKVFCELFRKIGCYIIAFQMLPHLIHQKAPCLKGSLYILVVVRLPAIHIYPFFHADIIQ